jgi:Uri superfamily endonuclease
MKGTYAIIMDLTRNKRISVGKLGKINFKKGYYLYVGSGQNSLETRIARHLRKKKKKFWHIDYLLSQRETRMREVWIAEDRRIECLTARKILEEINTPLLGKKFGSSDCKCPTHLFYLNQSKKLARDLLKRLNFNLYSIDFGAIP